MRLFPAIASLAVFVSANALADATINFRSTEGGGASLQSFQIGHGKLRADADGSTSVIMDPASRAMFVIDHDERTWMRIGDAEVAQLTAAIGGAMRQMEQAMAHVPPEMRAQMQGMIGGAIPGVGGGVKVTDTGRRDTVAGHACTIYQARMGNQTVNETCMGSVSAFDSLSAADRKVLEDAMRVSESMVEALAQGPLASLVDVSPFRAGMVPLRVVDIEGGRRSTSEFAGIDSAALSADLFEVPSGYRQQKIEIPVF